jgi:ActR/RegA family two-component response regulator
MLLDDDAELLRLLEGMLEADGMCVVQYTDPAAAVSAATTGEWVAALVNLDLPDRAAEVFLEVLGDLDDVNLPVVLTSTQREFAEVVQDIMGRFRQNLFLHKPIPLLDLNDMLCKAREGEEMDAFPNAGTFPSISVDLQLSDTNQVEFTPSLVTNTVSDTDLGSRRKQAVKGVIGAVQRGRGGIEELVELTDDDLAPISVLPDALQPIDSVADAVANSFEMEIDDDDDDDSSVHQVFLG